MTATTIRTPDRATWNMTADDLARTVAAKLGYTRNGNAIRDQHGRLVGMGWAAVAEKMLRAGWIEVGVGVHWRSMDLRPRRLPLTTRDSRGYWV